MSLRSLSHLIAVWKQCLLFLCSCLSVKQQAVAHSFAGDFLLNWGLNNMRAFWCLLLPSVCFNRLLSRFSCCASPLFALIAMNDKKAVLFCMLCDSFSRWLKPITHSVRHPYDFVVSILMMCIHTHEYLLFAFFSKSLEGKADSSCFLLSILFALFSESILFQTIAWLHSLAIHVSWISGLHPFPTLCVYVCCQVLCNQLISECLFKCVNESPQLYVWSAAGRTWRITLQLIEWMDLFSF